MNTILENKPHKRHKWNNHLVIIITGKSHKFSLVIYLEPTPTYLIKGSLRDNFIRDESIKEVKIKIWRSFIGPKISDKAKVISQPKYTSRQIHGQHRKRIDFA